VKIESSPVPRGGRAFRVARALFVDEGNPPQETSPWLRVRLLADMDVLGIDVWTSRGKRWQHSGLSSRIAQEDRSRHMIEARNQGHHELPLSTYTHRYVR
jgi:hypothetical protein